MRLQLRRFRRALQSEMRTSSTLPTSRLRTGNEWENPPQGLGCVANKEDIHLLACLAQVMIADGMFRSFDGVRGGIDELNSIKRITQPQLLRFSMGSITYSPEKRYVTFISRILDERQVSEYGKIEIRSSMLRTYCKPARFKRLRFDLVPCSLPGSLFQKIWLKSQSRPAL